ncbi:MAG: hypothetical protein ACTSR8_21895 [Promethearchaeota archaeon]
MTHIYEDVFFYIDLTKESLSKKDMIKAIKLYIEDKNKTNLKGHYGILIFQEEGNPVFITDKKDSKIITKAIEENWKNRLKTESYFENGLFYIFSYIAETIRKKSKNNRVIVITDTPSDLNEEYQEALFNLVDKIRHFPTFIDIIRITGGDRFFKDDVKLNILASDTKGGIFQVKDKKEFLDVLLNKLTKGKRLVTTFEGRYDEIKISTEDYAFYSNLAKNLQPPKSWEGITCYFCNETICPVCTDVYDVPQFCDDCGASFHNCCVTNYTITHNIGIPNIFRCPKCDILLKIDADEIIEVSGEEGVTTVKEYIGIDEFPTSLDLQEIPQSTSQKLKPPKIELPPMKESTPSLQTKSILSKETGEIVRTVRVGGFFGKQFKLRKVGDKLIYERVSLPYQAVVTTDIPTKDQKKETNIFKKRSSQSKLQICSICGTPAKKGQVKCKNCGSKI